MLRQYWKQYLTTLLVILIQQLLYFKTNKLTAVVFVYLNLLNLEYPQQVILVVISLGSNYKQLQPAQVINLGRRYLLQAIQYLLVHRAMTYYTGLTIVVESIYLKVLAQHLCGIKSNWAYHW